MQILGGVIIAVGVVLLVGNVTGFLVTFPFAGYITIVVGGMVMKMGKKQEE